ncbi:MAG: hypothetical protein MI741_14730, partial [Rhodospirillales bacterium]|nr:hypothetical protein [Rhodospirillales bacterium]
MHDRLFSPPIALAILLLTVVSLSFGPAALVADDSNGASQTAEAATGPETANQQGANELNDRPPGVFSKGKPESLEDLQAMQEHVRKLVDRVAPATVAVRVGGATGRRVVISKDGMVLTAGHVCY